jgi:hypothetical protein
VKEEFNLSGKRFGRLLVIERSENSRHGSARWKCICDCGKETTVSGSALRSGSTLSCGCMLKENRDRFKKERLKHGKSKDKLFGVWNDMIRRCRDKGSDDYKNYGGRGIIVCDRWKNNFANFLEDMGNRPDGFTIDRVDTNGNYCPENCIWASRLKQNRNARTSKRWHIYGKTFESCKQAGEYFGVNHVTIIRWCRSKMDCYSTLLYDKES